MHFFASFIPNILFKLCPKHPFFATNILCWSCSSTTCLFCNCRWQDGNNNYWIRFHMHLKTKLQSILWLLQCCCNYQIFNDKQEGNMDQKCKLGHTQILRDYFTKHPIYDDDLFNINIKCIAHYSFKSQRTYVHMILILFRKDMHAMF